MAFKDLREFIEELESRGLLRRIKTEVDAELEITEITDRVSKMEGEKNVALLFENVKGYDMPVLMNAFGSMERMSIALGVESLDEIAMICAISCVCRRSRSRTRWISSRSFRRCARR